MAKVKKQEDKERTKIALSNLKETLDRIGGKSSTATTADATTTDESEKTLGQKLKDIQEKNKYNTSMKKDISDTSSSVGPKQRYKVDRKSTRLNSSH